MDETGLLLLGKENKDNTYLLVQITPNGVHGLPVAALEKEGNQYWAPGYGTGVLGGAGEPDFPGGQGGDQESSDGGRL